MSSSRLHCFCLGLSLMLAGCGGGPAGPKTAVVTGKVTLDGKPVEQGSVTFIPTDGQGTSSGAKIANGTYRADVPYGPKRVEIRSQKKIGERAAYDTPDSPKVPIFEEGIPVKYNAESDLKTEVKAGTNTADFTMETPKT